MESSREDPSESAGLILPVTNPITNNSNNPNSTSPAANSTVPASASPQWPTIDGPLGLSEQDSVACARKFYKFGFLLLPLLWGVNCFYFWPVLRHSRSFPHIRPYIVRSAVVGFGVFSALLASWALTFSIGGERLFGHVWDELVMYNLAEKYGLTGWMLSQAFPS